MSNTAPFSVAWCLPADNRLPRLELFQRAHPDIGIRIDATDARVDMETTDVDLALRYSAPGHMPSHAVRLFGEQLTPVASPWLIKDRARIKKPIDLAQHALVEARDAHRTQHMKWLTWQRWFEVQGLKNFATKRRLYFNYAHQIAQAALAGQGVALARMPLVADSLASGDLV